MKTLGPRVAGWWGGNTTNNLEVVQLDQPLWGQRLAVFRGRALLRQREQIGFLDPELIKERFESVME